MITLAHIAFCIPFALLPIRARLRGVDLSVYEAAADWKEVVVDVEKTDTNSVTLRFATAPTAGAYVVAVIG